MRTNWKNKYESLVKINNATLLDNTAKQVIISSLKDQLTRLRKKSADALELVELLKWAKKHKQAVYIRATGLTTVCSRVPFVKLFDIIGEESSLLLAIREAKKIVEKENGK
ncbi:MAG: hypothetical protein WCW93_03895 [Candidatus Paceibacterota bacterium]|jgi:hypothetical protein